MHLNCSVSAEFETIHYDCDCDYGCGCVCCDNFCGYDYNCHDILK